MKTATADLYDGDMKLLDSITVELELHEEKKNGIVVSKEWRGSTTLEGCNVSIDPRVNYRATFDDRREYAVSIISDTVERPDEKTPEKPLARYIAFRFVGDLEATAQ